MRIVGQTPGLVEIDQNSPDLIFDILAGASLVLFDVTLKGGSNDFQGGAIANRGGLSVFRSQFIGNSSTTFGGALYNRGAASISNSTFAGNTSGGTGGAIYVEEGGVLDLINVTVSGNRTSNGGRGGGGLLNDGTATLNHVTFFGNAAVDGAPASFSNGGSATVTNTAFAASAGPNCGGDAFAGGSNFVALFDGFGWGADGSCTALADDVTGDPVLGLLADNGGGVSTHLPGIGSALIDNARAMSVSPQDARGIPRPQGARADIGAVEALDMTGPDTVITSGPLEGTMTSHTGTFEFESPDDPAATFECSLDGAAFAECASPYDWERPDGVHTFEVRARDAANNATSGSATARAALSS
jgi:predicted outer membrane repeat protein